MRARVVAAPEARTDTPRVELIGCGRVRRWRPGRAGSSHIRRCGRVAAAVPLSVMATPLAIDLTVVYEPVEDGWVMATIPEMPGVISQGRTRDEARENVRDALREVLFVRANASDSGSTQDHLRVTIEP